MTRSPDRRPVLGCIADDFTGATDLANNLVRSGMRTVQTIGIPAPADRLDADAIVIALKSRTIAAADAVGQSLQALRWLQAQGVEQVYFKYCSTFDSTPAGNIGPVTDALLDAVHGEGSGFTIACPAFPVNGRSVYKGHLFVGDQLLSDSSMRQHPLTPMNDSNLVRVLQAQSRRRVGLVPRELVASGPIAIREAFARLQAQGVGIAIVDAVADDDLLHIGKAVAGMRLLTAASGIGSALAPNWGISARVDAAELAPAAGFRAIVSGSCSAVTNAQVLAWRQQGGAAYSIDPLVIADGADVAGLVTRALDWAQSRLAEGPVLIYATAAPEAVKEVQSRFGVGGAGELVERTLASVARGLIERGVRQLIVAGGETSGAVVQAIGVQQMTIGPQIDPGVPWTTAPAAAASGDQVHLALKSGNFGVADFFAKAFSALDGSVR